MLVPRTWYGMPAYGDKNGKVICFFRSRDKFKERYMTIGFNNTASLDKDGMWPINFAIVQLTSDTEAKVVALIRQAVSGNAID